MREINPSQAARILSVHVKTVRRWCHEAVSGNPEARVQNVRRECQRKTPRYYLDADEVYALLDTEYDFF